MQEIELVKSEMKELRDEIKRCNDKVDLIYSALVGNEIEEDGGIVKRLHNVEDDLTTLNKFKDRVLWTIGTVSVACTGIGFVVQLAFNHFSKK